MGRKGTKKRKSGNRIAGCKRSENAGGAAVSRKAKKEQ